MKPFAERGLVPGDHVVILLENRGDKPLEPATGVSAKSTRTDLVSDADRASEAGAEQPQRAVDYLTRASSAVCSVARTITGMT